MAMFVAATCFAQQAPAPSPATDQLLAQLRSDQWGERARAYELLSADSKNLATPQVRGSLLRLLDRENRVIETVNRNPIGPSVDEMYGEEYAEYVGNLGETVDSFADWNDPRQVCIFVHEAYLAQSRFAAKIASHAKVAAPCLIQMYRNGGRFSRAQATAVLVQVLAKYPDQLDSATSATIGQVIRDALHDPDEAPRSETVRALGKFGGVDMIPALQQVAETDPAPEVQGRSIRKAAAAAIAAIQKRAGQSQP